LEGRCVGLRDVFEEEDAADVLREDMAEEGLE
jgi:hypothetical protein